MFVWVIVAAVVGARAITSSPTSATTAHNPGDVFAIWHGGLSSFGGLLFAVPTGILLTRRRCPELATARALDLVAPVLAAAWAMGRLLGPQLMVAGGGHPTTQWFGMYYATQVGQAAPGTDLPGPRGLRHLPGADLPRAAARPLARRLAPLGLPGRCRDRAPAWCCGASSAPLDQRLWLAYPGNLGSALVQVAGVALAVGGVVVLVVTRRRWHAWLAAGAPGRPPASRTS